MPCLHRTLAPTPRPRVEAALRGMLLLLLALAGAGCAGPPRHCVETPFGNVRGFERAGLDDLTERFLDEREFVLGAVPGTRDRFVELWQLDEASSEDFDRENVGGVTRQAREGRLSGLLPGWARHTRVLLGARTSDTTLTHELVHAYLDDEWSTLPPALEEGLADFVACAKHTTSRRRAEHFTVLLGYGPPLHLELHRPRRTSIGRLEHDVPRPAEPLDLAQVLELGDASPWNRHELIDTVWVYAAGHYTAERLVERIGLDGLHRLALDATEQGLARIPTERILAAADLASGQFDTVDLARRQARAMRQSALQDGPLLVMLEDLYIDAAYQGETARRCFHRLGAALRVGGDTPWPIDELPGFEAAATRFEAALGLALDMERRTPKRRRAGRPAAVERDARASVR